MNITQLKNQKNYLFKTFNGYSYYKFKKNLC